MAQYILKSALVAEIERKINVINLDSIEDWRYRLQREHDIEVMKDIFSLIDTLEVKEIASLQEEPVSIDFEQELYKAFGQVKDFTLGMRIAKWFYEMGKNSQEPVSEELEKELSAYVNSKEYTNSIGTSGLLLIARHFANWQKNKMMEDAVDGVVAESAGGDGWVNIATGFVKSEDVNVKFGDKIKIIVVKED